MRHLSRRKLRSAFDMGIAAKLHAPLAVDFYLL